MAIYRYLVTIETGKLAPYGVEGFLAAEIDSQLDSLIGELDISHFTVEPISSTLGQDYVERIIRSHES